EYNASVNAAMQDLFNTVQENVQKTIEEKPAEVVEQLEKHKAETEKRSIEDDIRAHLRGFSRTIPSFIMAYGDGELTLANFDTKTEEDVFLEVTGITADEFRFLRDGGEYDNPETGAKEHFAGHLFDEVVFDDSIEEFWKKKEQLADYFDETHDEDIFDYIPPQKTNQIFTPKWVVKKMVDELEENSPGCFDDPNKTFADLYMKSGLYITEIVKRLYRSEAIKAAFPDDKERISHILNKQVYGMAPTRIIYLIATNYILGFDETLKTKTHNFVCADAAEAAKNGTLEELVERCFGK
ncbi:MAG: restriction endonuclease, partial [Butyrivibrio sp.]|nr:restriction endonuclease [Butyrivibrio sp.]